MAELGINNTLERMERDREWQVAMLNGAQGSAPKCPHHIPYKECKCCGGNK